MPNSPQESASKKLEHVVADKTGALHPSDSVQTAGDRMRAVEANAWPVAEAGKLVGLIDHPNPDHRVGGHGHDPRATRVGDTMRHEAVFCYEDQDAAEAERIMKEHRLNHLPVVDRNMRIVGIISRDDVKARDRAAEEDAVPVQDWKPGETRPHGTDGRSPDDWEPGMDGDADALDPVEDRESEPRAHFGHEAAADVERFPFRAPVDGAEAR